MIYIFSGPTELLSSSVFRSYRESSHRRKDAASRKIDMVWLAFLSGEKGGGYFYCQMKTKVLQVHLPSRRLIQYSVDIGRNFYKIPAKTFNKNKMLVPRSVTSDILLLLSLPLFLHP